MIELTLNNTHLTIQGVDQDGLDAIDAVTSYPIKNAWFTNAYRSKRWDGKEHLLTYSRKNGYRVHAGCTPDVVRALDNLGLAYDLRDTRVVPNYHVEHGWTGQIMSHGDLVDLEMRDYQGDAVRAILADSLPRGRCMLRMPIRSGKTVTAGLLIGALRLRTLFLVTSDILLNQTIDVFSHMFEAKVGVVGAGEWEPSPLTVAMIQTINARVKEKYCAKFLSSYDLVIFDECHHLKAEKWKQIALSCPAYWKIGLSATIFLDHKRANERENIWLKACTGDVVYSVTTRQLIESGWLVQPTVEIYTIRGPVVEGDWTDEEVYKRGIVRYKRRNELIARLAVDAATDGSRVMVMAQQHEHIDSLYDAIDGQAAVEKLTGKIRGMARKGVVNRFKKGKTSVIVGNVFGEGVDIPEVDVVINAEGGESKVRAIQRMRNLTPSPGKDHVRVIDFADTHNKHLAKHSRSRVRAYNEENAFKIVTF